MRTIIRAAVLTLAVGMLAVGAPSTGAASEALSYKQAGDRALAAHVFRPEGQAPGEAAPAILLFHGGGWRWGEPAWTFPEARRFRDLGLVAVAVEYRLSVDGVTPGEALADACDAFAWARTHAAELGIDPARIAAYGISAGGQLAGAAALGACGPERPGPALLVLWSPAVDVARDGWFQRLMGGGGEPDVEAARAVSPVALAQALAPDGATPPPMAVVQGEADTLTPIRGARALCEALTAAGGECALHAYPGLGHLLTRNLENQEGDFDPDPQAREDGGRRLDAFLVEHGYGRAPR